MNSARNKRKIIQNQPEAKQGTQSKPFIGPIDIWCLKNQKSFTLDVATKANVTTDNQSQDLAPSSQNDKDAGNLVIIEEEFKKSPLLRQKEAEANLTETQVVSTSTQKKTLSLMDQLITEEERLGLTQPSMLVPAFGFPKPLIENEVKTDKKENVEQQPPLANNLAHYDTKSLISKIGQVKNKNNTEKFWKEDEDSPRGYRRTQEKAFDDRKVFNESGTITKNPIAISSKSRPLAEFPFPPNPLLDDRPLFSGRFQNQHAPISSRLLDDDDIIWLQTTPSPALSRNTVFTCSSKKFPFTHGLKSSANRLTSSVTLAGTTLHEISYKKDNSLVEMWPNMVRKNQKEEQPHIEMEAPADWHLNQSLQARQYKESEDSKKSKKVEKKSSQPENPTKDDLVRGDGDNEEHDKSSFRGLKVRQSPTKVFATQNVPPRIFTFSEDVSQGRSVESGHLDSRRANTENTSKKGPASRRGEEGAEFHDHRHHSKLKQENNGKPAESESFPPFKFPGSVDKMDLSHYLDLLTKFVKEHKIYFTTDVEAEEYFEKCDRRYHWGFGLEWIRILNVLRGINTQKMVKDKETALLEFLMVRDEGTGEVLLDLARTSDYCKFSQHLKNRHPDDFHRLVSFLKASDSLIAYMRMIIRAPYGYFPDKGATQNLVLWLCGKTQCGKTSLAQIITSFLVVCKMRATNEKFMNTCGDNNIRNKPLSFNIFQLEELKKSGKGAADLMDLMDAGVSVIKGKEASGWGSDSNGDAYHFPILITSNYHPCEFFSSKNLDDRLFQEAALSRIICIEVNRSSLPNVSRTNLFGVPRLELAQFVWAFIYHSEIETTTDAGESLCQPVTRRYEEPDSVELTLQDLSLSAGKKVHMMTSSLTLMTQHYTNIYQQRLELPIQDDLLMEERGSANIISRIAEQRKKNFILPMNDAFDDSQSLISLKTSPSARMSFSTEYYFLPVKQFLMNTALLLRRSGNKTFKARELHQEFVHWFQRLPPSEEQDSSVPPPPTEQLFGKLLSKIKGVYKIRRSNAHFYELDINYLCASLIV